jgi:transposase
MMGMTRASWQLPEELWQLLEPRLPVLNARRGRPRRVDLKRIAAGIFFVLRTGIQWQALPREQFGPASTVYYYFRQWEEAGVFEDVWAAAVAAFDEEVGLDWTWQSIDGCMTKAPLGGENERAESDRPRQVGDEAERAYGRRRHTHRHYGRWRQSTRSDAPGGDPGCDGDRPTSANRQPTAASLLGCRV